MSAERPAQWPWIVQHSCIPVKVSVYFSYSKCIFSHFRPVGWHPNNSRQTLYRTHEFHCKWSWQEARKSLSLISCMWVGTTCMGVNVSIFMKIQRSSFFYSWSNLGFLLSQSFWQRARASYVIYVEVKALWWIRPKLAGIRVVFDPTKY